MKIAGRELDGREEADLQIARGLEQVCLSFGASLSTALVVPGLFVKQLEMDRHRDPHSHDRPEAT